MRKGFLLILLLTLSGCSIVTEKPTNECRISVLEGKGRVGDFITNYAKGDAKIMRLSQEGTGCPEELDLMEIIRRLLG